MKTFRLRSMQRLINYRTLMTMMLVGGMFFFSTDVFGQSATSHANCVLDVSVVDCSFAAGEGADAGGFGSVALIGGETTSGGTSALAAIGTASGDNSIILGPGEAAGDHSIALGTSETNGDYTYAFGDWITTDASSTHNIIIGGGIFGSTAFDNDISNSIMLGFNSDISTMFIEGAAGATGSLGRVGIGTTDPDALLHLKDESGDDTYMIIEKATADDGGILWHDGAVGPTGAVSASIVLDGSDDLTIENRLQDEDIIFEVNDGGTADEEIMRLEAATQRVGINVDNPDGTLHVMDHAGATQLVLDAPTGINTSQILFEHDGSLMSRVRTVAGGDFVFENESNNDDISFQITDNSTNVEVMRIDGSASGVGILTTTPQGALDVNGTMFAALATGGGGNNVQLVAGQLVEFTSTINHKANIEDLEIDKEAFFNLRPVSYTWKEAHGGFDDVGLIAEEVEQVMPNMVNYSYKRTYINETTGELLRDSTGNPVLDTTQMQPWGVDYRKISVYLLALAKEQDSLVQSMQSRVSLLESMVQDCCTSEPSYRTNESLLDNSVKNHETSLRVYPNPNDGNFNMTYNLGIGESAKLYVVSVSGEKMLVANNLSSKGTENINITGPSGVYQVILENSNGETLQNVKVVIAR